MNRPSVDQLRHREHSALINGGRHPSVEEWSAYVDEAAERCAGSYPRFEFETTLPRSWKRPEPRYVLGDRVALPASVLLGVEAELAHALADNQALRESNAELRATFVRAGQPTAEMVRDVAALRRFAHSLSDAEEPLTRILDEVERYRAAATISGSSAPLARLW